MNKKAPNFEKEAMDCMLSYAWPGNVRELRNIVERLIVMNRNEAVSVKDLPEEISKEAKARPSSFSEEEKSGSLQEAREDFEREYLLAQLMQNRWNVTKTAKQLGIARKNLYQKMKKLNLLDKEC